MNVEELLEIESVRRVRLAYSRYFDGQQIDQLATLFCEDAVCEFPEEFGGDWVGRDTIIENFALQMKGVGEPYDVMHVVTNPWVVIESPTEATGSCYLMDFLTRQSQGEGAVLTSMGGHANPLMFLGMYEDRYRKEDGQWRFSRVRLPLFWPQRMYQMPDVKS